MVKIHNLSDTKGLYPIAAYWAYIHWYLLRDIPFKAILNEYRRRAGGDGPPFTYIALNCDTPCGMITLKKNDLLSRPDLSPWLSTLYVAPEFRGKGIGSLLINQFIEECRKTGYDKVYLFIDNRDYTRLEKFYKSRGWQYLDSAPDSDGGTAEIYCFTL